MVNEPKFCKLFWHEDFNSKQLDLYSNAYYNHKDKLGYLHVIVSTDSSTPLQQQAQSRTLEVQVWVDRLPPCVLWNSCIHKKGKSFIVTKGY